MLDKIMVVDDDPNICELLRLYLEKENFDVVIASDGRQALKKFDMEAPDLILLDIMLPELDGWQVCREIRKKSQCPIIMITAKGEVFDKVLGLELGADDYIVKPFETKEVVARIKAVLRRLGKNGNGVVKEVHYDKLSINLTNYELKVNGKIIDTPPKEMELIYHLASNPNRVFTRDQLLDEVWGFDYYGDSRTVDVHVKRLREKLEGVSDQWCLKTVWGVGYKFEVKDDDDDLGVAASAAAHLREKAAESPDSASKTNAPESDDFAPVPALPEAEKKPKRTLKLSRKKAEKTPSSSQ